MTNVESTLTPDRILIVDDDRRLTSVLSDYLRSHGFDAAIAHDGVAAVAAIRAERWQLIILDVMLPRTDGFSVLAQLRQISNVPVLMLTARGGESDRILGLDSGADDYLPKTASAREILSRVRALLRRAVLATPRRPRETDLTFGALRIQVESRSVQLNDDPLALTPVEFDLLLALAENEGRAMSRKELLDRVRDREFDANDRSIDVHVAALRRKLGDDPRTPHYIRTVRAAGYVFIPCGEKSS
jgi:DNA-binding response OmpR family regulator